MQKQKWDETEVVLQPFFYSTKYSKALSVSIIFNQFPIIFGSRTNFPNRSTLYETHKVEAFEVGAGMWDPGTTHSGFHWVSFFFTLHPFAPETISRNLVDPINSLDGCAIIYLTNLCSFRLCLISPCYKQHCNEHLYSLSWHICFFIYLFLWTFFKSRNSRSYFKCCFF